MNIFDIPYKIIKVTGFAQKRLWNDIDIQDEVRSIITFDNGVTAMLNYSTIACVRRPLWRILGTMGAIVDSGEGPVPGATIPGYGEELTVPSCGSFKLTVLKDGEKEETNIPYDESNWPDYYRDLAGHILHNKPVPVSGEEGRRVVAVLQAAERSWTTGQSQPVQYES